MKTNFLQTCGRSLGFCLTIFFVPGTATLAQSNLVPFELHRAVQVTWPAADGRQYRLYASPDLHNWSPASPVIPGLGATGTYAFETDGRPCNNFRLLQLAGLLTNRFVGLQQIWWDQAVVTKDTNSLTFFNLRLQSATLSPDDLVQATFSFDTITQAFRLSAYTVFPGVGVYSDPYLATDNVSTVYIYQTNQSPMPEGQFYTVNADGSDYYLDLAVGHVLSFNIHPLFGDVRFEFIDPDGQMLEDSILLVATGVITGSYPIIKSGRYTARFISYGGSGASVDFAFLNANRRLLTAITNGSQISCNFANGIRDYAKYEVDLQTNQLLAIRRTYYSGNGPIRSTLVNSHSGTEVSTTSHLKFISPTSGRFYLFISNDRGWGSSFGAMVSISPVTNTIYAATSNLPSSSR